MRASQFIHLCFFVTLALILVAGYLHLRADPMAKDLFVLMSPLFFNMAAKRAVKYRTAAVVIALLGVMFAGGALYAGLNQKPRPAAAEMR